jgi:hypothetical protein
MSGAILGIAAVAAAALPAATQAGDRADYKQIFTSRVPGAPAGSDTRILYKHPDDPEAKPIPVRREVFIFPRGTRWDGSIVPDCTASEQELQMFGEMACPSNSRIGAGRGTFMTGFPPDGGETPMEIDIFDAGSGFLVLGGPEGGSPLRFATRGRRKGRVVTVDVPRPPGGPPEGESVLRKVHNVVGAHSRGRRTYMRTPRVCPPSGVWTFRARFTFADGVVEKDVHRMRCRPT